MKKFFLLITFTLTTLFADTIHINAQYGSLATKYQTSDTSSEYISDEITTYGLGLGYEFDPNHVIYLKMTQPQMSDDEKLDLLSLDYRLLGLNPARSIGVFIELSGAQGDLDSSSRATQEKINFLGLTFGMLLRLTQERLYFEAGYKTLSNEPFRKGESEFALKSIQNGYLGLNFRF